jgi:hypothetical protein
VALCAASLAQAPVAGRGPVRAKQPPRYAGSVDVTTGRWTKVPAPRAGASAVQTIYNNTCTWTGGVYFMPMDECEEVHDEGRIPSTTSNPAFAGTQDTYAAESFQIAYCTVHPTGTVDMEVAFWHEQGPPTWTAGGSTCFNQPPTPPPISSSADAYFDLAGLGLPGSTSLGVQSCWIVDIDVSSTGWCIVPDGNGAYQFSQFDVFFWSFSQNNSLGPWGESGPLLAGNWAVGFQNCIFAEPCATDPNLGTSCGTGLNTADDFWLNVDGVAMGTTASLPCTGWLAPWIGTSCFWGWGYPSGPVASFWMKIEGSSACGPVVSSFCSQTKPTSVPGCVPTLHAVGTESIATTHWITIKVPMGPGNTSTIGLHLYTAGVGIGQSTFSASTSFGLLCLQGFQRAGPAVTTIQNLNTCYANFDYDLGAHFASLAAMDPNLVVGADINVQNWHRDPAAPGTANLTNAVFYTIR